MTEFLWLEHFWHSETHFSGPIYVQLSRWYTSRNIRSKMSMKIHSRSNTAVMTIICLSRIKIKNKLKIENKSDNEEIYMIKLELECYLINYSSNSVLIFFFGFKQKTTKQLEENDLSKATNNSKQNVLEKY